MFLRQTSVLTTLDGPSCDFTLQSAGSHDLLLRAAQGTLLIAPVHGVSSTYRLHPLIREHLVAELTAHDPDLARGLHSRAAEWTWQSGFADEAIRHALASGDTSLIGRLVWATAQPALTYGRIERVRAWTSPLSDTVILQSAELCMTATWTAVAGAEPVLAAHWAAATVEALGPAWPGQLGESTVAASLALLLALQGAGGFDAAAKTAAAAGAALPLDSTTRPLCKLAEGWCRALSGDVRGGSESMTDALAAAQAMKIGATWVEAASLLAFVQAATGRWVAADLHIGIARRAWIDHDLDGFSTSTTLLTSVSAWLHARDGHLDDARTDLTRASAGVEHVARTLPWVGPFSDALAARTESLLGQSDAAVRALSRATAGLAEIPESPFIRDFIAATRQDVEQRTPLAALTPAERRVWDLLRQGFSRREMASALFVSDDTVKTHVAAIYRKTNIKNRREAIRLGASLETGSA